MCETSLSAPDRQRDALSTRQVTDQEAPVRASPRTKTSLPHRSPNATVHAAGLTASYGKAGVLTGDLDFRALPGTEAVYPARAPFHQKQSALRGQLLGSSGSSGFLPGRDQEPIEQPGGLRLAARHEVPVAVVGDLDPGVAHIG